MLAVRTPLLPDESLDSWIETLAELNITAPGALLPRGEKRVTGLRAPLSHNMVSRVLPKLARLTGTNETQLYNATLHRFKHAGLEFRIDGHTQSRSWPANPGSRYCPECLIDRDLRWKLEWTIGFITICPTHNVALVDYCPHCGSRPRRRGQFLPRNDFQVIDRERVKSCPARCNSRALARAETISVPNQSPLIPTHVTIRELLYGAEHSLAYSDGNALATSDILVDLHHVFRAALAAITNRAIPERELGDTGIDPKLIRAGYPEASTDYAAQQWSKSVPSLMTGLAMVLATQVLTREEIPQWFTRETTKSLVIKRSKKTKNPPSRYIDRLVGKARNPYPSTEKTDTHGRRRRQHSVLALRYARPHAIDSASLPASLWQNATLHAPEMPPRLQRTFPILTPIALAAIGRDAKLSPLSKEFGIEEDEKVLQQLLHQLVSNEYGQDLWHYIIELHDHVHQYPPPIDYRRRRRLFPRPEPLGPIYERRLSRAGNATLTNAFRWKISRYVWQLLTGFDPLATAHRSVLHGPAAYDFKKFVRTMHPDLQDTAGEIAERKLLKHKIGEPVAIDLVRDLDHEQWIPSYTTRHFLTGINRNDLRRSSLSLRFAASTAGDPEELLHIALMGEVSTALKLYRFAVTSDCATNTEAARRLGLTQNMYHSDMKTIETAIGNDLFVAATKSKPRSFTTLGATLLALLRPALPDLRRIVGPKRIADDH